jgi:hypothetical protein
MQVMILRVLLSLVGAVVITSSLLLGMDAVTSIFRERDTTRYYRISDVQLRSNDGRPDRPAPVPLLPETPESAVELPSSRVDIEAPTAPANVPAAPARVRSPAVQTDPAAAPGN